MSRPDGGNVFPSGSFVVDDNGSTAAEVKGMTRRQWYAGMAAQGYMAAMPWGAQPDVETVARKSWAVADALIATEDEE